MKKGTSAAEDNVGAGAFYFGFNNSQLAKKGGDAYVKLKLASSPVGSRQLAYSVSAAR